MKRKNKGFTLIELLAVIVILGLLMAIAIPSVTKYITQSRKKTVTSTIGNYMSALTTQVNDMEYVFTATNTIYAVPIECIALERGGTNPFGEWHQASNSYWAYVLVQYDDATSSYTYGFTFKDSAGYGLYPTTSEKLKESGSQIQQDLSLTRPTNGTITNITAKTNWLGFDVKDDTKLVVLVAESEGISGDGKTSCTLCQKGSNYEEVEESKNTLARLIRKHNTLITAAPTLTTSSSGSGDTSGLYSSTDTNSGNPTYYFRGNVTNNYVSFAGLMWRAVRINEDGSVRIILQNGINSNTRYKFGDIYGNDYEGCYYSNSNIAKPTLETWYENNLLSYDSYIANELFCEQIFNKNPLNFKCVNNEVGKGLYYSKIGLLTVAEAIYAGYSNYNSVFFTVYLLDRSNNYDFWLINQYYKANVGDVRKNGMLYQGSITNNWVLRPVINLNANVLATGTGTSSDPYVVQTN